MYNSNRGNNRFGGRRDFERRDSSDRPSMHRTTCGKCGNDCEVPFRPTGERPVYCSKCFQNNRHSDSRRYNNNFENKNDNVSKNSDAQFKKQFETLNLKLDKILKIITPVVEPDIIKAEKMEEKPAKAAKKKKKVKA